MKTKNIGLSTAVSSADDAKMEGDVLPNEMSESRDFNQSKSDLFLPTGKDQFVFFEEPTDGQPKLIHGRRWCG